MNIRACLTERLCIVVFASMLTIIPSFSVVCFGQSAQEIMDRSNKVMAPPIKYRMNISGSDCVVYKKKLTNEITAERIEFGISGLSARITIGADSFEIDRKSKSVINTGFMMSDFSNRLAAFSSGAGAAIAIRSLTHDVIIVSDDVLQGKPCWRLSKRLKVEARDLFQKLSTARTGKPDNQLPVDGQFLIDKQNYDLLRVESFTSSGTRIDQKTFEKIERPENLSNDMFAPPENFDRHNPKSFEEYVSLKKSLFIKAASELTAIGRIDSKDGLLKIPTPFLRSSQSELSPSPYRSNSKPVDETVSHEGFNNPSIAIQSVGLSWAKFVFFVSILCVFGFVLSRKFSNWRKKSCLRV